LFLFCTTGTEYVLNVNDYEVFVHGVCFSRLIAASIHKERQTDRQIDTHLLTHTSNTLDYSPRHSGKFVLTLKCGSSKCFEQVVCHLQKPVSKQLLTRYKEHWRMLNATEQRISCGGGVAQYLGRIQKDVDGSRGALLSLCSDIGASIARRSTLLVWLCVVPRGTRRCSERSWRWGKGVW
jgi:hypothetical protein